jgi:hypothetical protein
MDNDDDDDDDDLETILVTHSGSICVKIGRIIRARPR